jgi:enoyl-CoA hydratase/carnithine racemase
MKRKRGDDIALVGLNRPFIQNRLDPPTRVRLAEVFYQYEHDASLRAAVLFGHGEKESYRIGITQQLAPTPEAALEAAVAMARKIAACAPLSIKATLASAHQVIDAVEADALSKLGAQYSALYRTEDFLEGRRAEAEGRPPKYQGK